MARILRTVEALMEVLRGDLQDKVVPFFWEDEELIRYLDEAQFEFCEAGYPIIDSRTDSICRIAYNEGTFEVELHESIMEILEAWREDSAGQRTPLEVATQENYLSLYPQGNDDYGLNGSASHMLNKPKRVTAIFVDYEEDWIRFNGLADQDDILVLRVSRRPAKHFEEPEDKIEIRRHYEPALFAWAKHLAWGKQDGETFDEKASMREKDKFDELAFKAHVAFERKHHPPGTVQCSFGTQ